MATEINSRMLIKNVEELSKEYQAAMKACLEQYGLKNVYCKILSVLSERDGDTQLDLVHRTGLQAPTVSITLRKMEREELVSRVSDDNDLRKSHVYITEKGRVKNQEATRIIKEFEGKLLDGISNDEAETFVAVLEKLGKNIK